MRLERHQLAENDIGPALTNFSCNKLQQFVQAFQLFQAFSLLSRLQPMNENADHDLLALGRIQEILKHGPWQPVCIAKSTW